MEDMEKTENITTKIENSFCMTQNKMTQNTVLRHLQQRLKTYALGEHDPWSTQDWRMWGPEYFQQESESAGRGSITVN